MPAPTVTLDQGWDQSTAGLTAGSTDNLGQVQVTTPISDPGLAAGAKVTIAWSVQPLNPAPTLAMVNLCAVNIGDLYANNVGAAFSYYLTSKFLYIVLKNAPLQAVRYTWNWQLLYAAVV